MTNTILQHPQDYVNHYIIFWSEFSLINPMQEIPNLAGVQRINSLFGDIVILNILMIYILVKVPSLDMFNLLESYFIVERIKMQIILIVRNIL